MKKAAIWLIIAVSLVLLGGIIFVGALYMAGWDFKALGNNNYKTNTVDIAKEFQRISVVSDTEDVVFALSKDGNCKVVFYERDNEKHSASVVDNTLLITNIEDKKWYEHISFFSFGTPKITVYMPQSEYDLLTVRESTGDVEIPKDFTFGGIDVSVSTGDINCFASAKDAININTSTGDIYAKDFSAKQVNISVSTGRTKLQNIECDNLSSSGSTGDIILKDVICKEKMTISRSTGDVKLLSSDSSELFIKTDTGDVAGSLLTNKVFITQSDTGEIDVPETLTGGKCKITTDTGDITISIE